jgi:excisionase family DNA binding protein
MSPSAPTMTAPPEAAILPQFLTARQIARATGCANATIYAWAQQGLIPHVRLGRCVRFNLRDVEAWLAQAARPGRRDAAGDSGEVGA